MSKKMFSVGTLILLLCLLCSCGNQNQTDYLSWLPDTTSEEISEQGGSEESVYRKNNRVTTDASNASTYYPVEDLVKALLNEESDKLADYIWEDQIANGVYSVTEEDLSKNMLVYYVSSSEGDDSNLGLSPDKPKKTLEQFSGTSRVTVLLKCGDTFDLTSPFSTGNGCTYATYGKGPRPIVNLYQELDVSFSKVPGLKNIWKADLTGYSGLYSEVPDKDNCNIGQLVIDGKVNWKRIVVSSKDAEALDFATCLSERNDGAWTVDWLQSTLYIQSDKDPNEQSIQYAPDHHGIIINKVEDVILKGWEITGAGAHGCNITDGINVSIMNCYFAMIGGSVHRSAGVRYGNAIQVWNSGADIRIAYNYADWIFDSCYTNQGSSATTGNNIRFTNNIGAHSFTGIETWGDTYSSYAFHDLVYQNNILFHMCDITNPKESTFADSDGKLISNTQEEPVINSYRGGYAYHQMTNLNISTSQEPGGLKILDNVFWNTNRFLVLVSSSETNNPEINGNLFFSQTTTYNVNPFRYINQDGENTYSKLLPWDNNETLLTLQTSLPKTSQEMKRLTENMNRIIMGL